MATLGQKVQAAGAEIVAAERDQVSAAVATQLQTLFGSRVQIGGGFIVDADRHRSEHIPVLVRVGEPVEMHDVATPVYATESVAAAIDVMRTLTLEGLAASYRRVATAKALHKTTSLLAGGPQLEATLGVILAVDMQITLTDMATELERLNATTHSDNWPDVIAVLKHGQVSYGMHWLGNSAELGNLLPPSPGTLRKFIPAYYTVMMALSSGSGTFNRLVHLLSGQLVRWSPDCVLTGYETILDGVPRDGLNCTSYQYNLAGELRPVPRGHYKDRLLPPKAYSLCPRGGTEPVGSICYFPWQDGGVVLLDGKLPLSGLLVFLGGVINPDVLRKAQIVTQGDLQISTVLPIDGRRFAAFLRNIQTRGGLDVKPSSGHKFVIKPFCDEGTTSPFVTRIVFAPMQMADVLGPRRDALLEAHRMLITTLMEIRDIRKEVHRVWRDYERDLDEGKIVQQQGPHVRISKNVDRELGRLVSEFLTGATRSFKDCMQRVASLLGMDIGLLHQKQSKFESGLAELRIHDDALADYLASARVWGNALVEVRNKLDHSGWRLQGAVVLADGGKVRAIEPTINVTPVTQWVAEMTDHVLCFVEDVVAHGIQCNLGAGTTLVEISRSERNPDMPLRFRFGLSCDGCPSWRLQTHATTFEET